MVNQHDDDDDDDEDDEEKDGGSGDADNDISDQRKFPKRSPTKLG